MPDPEANRDGYRAELDQRLSAYNAEASPAAMPDMSRVPVRFQIAQSRR